MNARARCFQLLPKLRLWFGIAWLGAGVSAFAQTAYKFDAATVSGLPARNIGSAMMSGRVAALDAVHQDGRITVFLAAASGGGWGSPKGGRRRLPGLPPGRGEWRGARLAQPPQDEEAGGVGRVTAAPG